MIDDWEWFGSRVGRNYRHRVATPNELASLAAKNAMPNMPPGCFVYAISRINRSAVRIETVLVVLESGPELDEEEAMAAWYDADAVISAAIVNGMDGDHERSKRVLQ